MAALGARLSSVEPSGARLELPYREENANRNGTLHGGVLAAAMDMVAAAAACAGLSPPRRTGASIIDLTVHYLLPVKHEDVAAVARVVRRGHDIAFVEVLVSSARGKEIARGLVAHRAGAIPGRGAAPRARPPDPSVAPPEPAAIDSRRALADLPRLRPSRSPFSARLGVASTPLGRGRAVSHLPLGDDLLDEDGRVHEGALAALADCAGGAASWSIDGFDPRARAATIGMHLCFDVSTRDEDVVAEAVNSWWSGGVYVNNVTIWGHASQRAIAAGSVTYRIARREGRA